LKLLQSVKGTENEQENLRVFYVEENMKKGLNLIFEDEDIIELLRILIDEDAEGALVFLKTHFKGKARHLLEGG
jgi:hypothetical protein